MAEHTENTIRKVIENFLSQLYQVIRASLRLLPTETGDGTYITNPSSPTGVLQDIRHVNLKDVEYLINMTKQAASGKPIDDRNYIMEHVVQVCEQSDGLMTMKSLTDGSCPLSYLSLLEIARR